MKQRGYHAPADGFKPIHMPHNTGAGFIIAGFASVCGFALIWHIWWLAALTFVGAARRSRSPTRSTTTATIDVPAERSCATESERTQHAAGAGA